MKRSWLKRILTYRFTFLLVPHGAGTPRQVSVHLSFVLFLTAVWAGVTFWGSYLSAQHVDYWRTQASNEVLKMKVKYLMAQVDQSRGYMDEVKSVDNQLRTLLKYQTESMQKNGKTASAAPAQPMAAAAKGEGGPTSADMGDLARELARTDMDVSWSKMVEQVTLMKLEAHERVSSFKDLSEWIEAKKKVFRATPRGWPCSGHITSHYGLRIDPLTRLEEMHPGLDIANGAGTPVRATAEGIVRIANWRNGYGNIVVVDHPCGFQTRYAHNSRILVRPGQHVRRGQVLAFMGTTGHSTGPHCHYEVWRYSQRKNPIAFLPETPAGAGGILAEDLDSSIQVASK